MHKKIIIYEKLDDALKIMIQENNNMRIIMMYDIYKNI